MDRYEWFKKYRIKLGKAWAAGCDDRLAAKRAGLEEAELVSALEDMPELRDLRDSKVDSILLKAQENIAEAIADGDKRLSQWYIDRMDRRFGSKGVSVTEDGEDALDDILDGLKAKPGMFDE